MAEKIEDKKKTKGQELKEKLLANNKNGWLESSEADKKAILKFSDGYIKFLNNGKTERECVKLILQNSLR